MGNADPQALVVAVAAMQAAEFVGLPECQLPPAQAVIYEGGIAPQNYLPEERRYYKPTDRGFEPELRGRLEEWRRARNES